MSALAGVLDLPSTPTFDVRAIAAPAAAAAYLSGLTRTLVVRGADGTPMLIGPLAILGGADLPLPAGVDPGDPSVLRALAAQAPLTELVSPLDAARPAAALRSGRTEAVSTDAPLTMASALAPLSAHPERSGRGASEERAALHSRTFGFDEIHRMSPSMLFS